MDKDSNIVKARSSIVWIVAILSAFAAVWWIEKESGKELVARQQAVAAPAGKAAALTFSSNIPTAPAPRELTPQELQWARIAWSWFERNTDIDTGLAPSVEGFGAATLWDTASSLLALISAHDLGLIDKKTFDLRMAKALVSLERMPLYAKQLPNKSYDAKTLAMTDYQNKPVEAGIGWSAIDIGRLLVPLNVLAWHHPIHTEAARRVLARWDTSQLARDGQLWGMEHGAGSAAQAVQEGRMGYEQYAAHTLALMGLDVEAASDWNAHLQLADVDGIKVCADARDPKRFGAQNFVVSEPYMLAGLEFGWTRHGRECAWRVYQAQEQRFRKTGTLTAVSEDHVDQAPYFVYNSVWTAGQPWAAVTEKGEDASALRTMSVKAAFAWHALFRTEYTGKLVEKASTLNDPAKGFYAGVYEQGGKANQALSANTNAVVLESLAYFKRGAALQVRRPGDLKP